MPTQRHLPGKLIDAAAARAKLSRKGERVKALSSHGCFCKADTVLWLSGYAEKWLKQKARFVPTTKL